MNEETKTTVLSASPTLSLLVQAVALKAGASEIEDVSDAAVAELSEMRWSDLAMAQSVIITEVMKALTEEMAGEKLNEQITEFLKGESE